MYPKGLSQGHSGGPSETNKRDPKIPKKSPKKTQETKKIPIDWIPTGCRERGVKSGVAHGLPRQ